MNISRSFGLETDIMGLFSTRGAPINGGSADIESAHTGGGTICPRGRNGPPCRGASYHADRTSPFRCKIQPARKSLNHCEQADQSSPPALTRAFYDSIDAFLRLSFHLNQVSKWHTIDRGVNASNRHTSCRRGTRDGKRVERLRRNTEFISEEN